MMTALAFCASTVLASESFVVDIEITEKRGKTIETLRASVAVGEGCSTISLQSPSLGDEIRICPVGDSQAPVLSFEVERHDRANPQGSHQRLRASARIARGQPVTLAELVRGDTSTRIVATVH
jgi:hypothetical protein